MPKPPRPAPRSLPQTERHDELRAYLLELYARCASVPVPPDQLIGRFFRLRRNLPPPARGFLGASVYSLLRNRVRTLHLVQWAGRSTPMFDWSEPGEAPKALTPVEEAACGVLRWLVEELKSSHDEALAMACQTIHLAKALPQPEGEFPLPEWGEPEKLVKEFAARYAADPGLANAPAEIREAAELSIPTDILARWRRQFGDAGGRALAIAMREPAPLDIRVNRAKTTREALAAKLITEGFDNEPCRFSPDGIRLIKKGNLFKLPIFEDGHFEVQDEGSQLVAFAVDPHPNWRVLDACAGGGGKTLHLAGLMKNKGQVLAHDLTTERLDGLRKRLKRAGLDNIRLLEPGEGATDGPYDAVLIDAPCLGLGTLRRNPDFAWRGGIAKRLGEVRELQQRCLADYTPLVKKGGYLIYATCSLEPEETTDMVNLEKMAAFGFEPAPLSQPLGHHKIEGLSVDGHTLFLTPSVHGTDGFFVARFKKM